MSPAQGSKDPGIPGSFGGRSALLTFLLFWALGLPAQTLHFDHFTTVDGLSQNHVTALLQDQKGFLWIGTRDGLNRYDGRAFRVFRHVRGDSASLSHNYITRLAEDPMGRIWVGTHRGLNCYEPELDRFRQYWRPPGPFSEPENNILGLCVDRRGQIWYGTYHGLFRLDPATGEQTHFLPPTDGSAGLNHAVVWDIYEAPSGVLWVGTQEGANRLMPDGGSFQPFLRAPGETPPKVWAFAEPEPGTIWIGTNQGVYSGKEDPGGWQFSHYRHEPGVTGSLSHDFVQSFHLDGEGLWIPTYDGGLNFLPSDQFDSPEPVFRHYRYAAGQSGGLSSDEAEVAFRDRSGVLWVGTAVGLDRFSPFGKKFATSHLAATPFSQNDPVTALCLDPEGRLWAGSRGGGLYVLDPETGRRLQVFRHDPGNPHSLPHDDVYGLLIDRRHRLWVATYHGLAYLEPGSLEKPVFHSFDRADGLPYGFVHGLYESDKGEIWIATYGGLSRLHETPGRGFVFENFSMDDLPPRALVNSTTYQLAQDRFGYLWVATYDGLSRIVEEEDGGVWFDNYRHEPGDPYSLQENWINVLFRDSAGRLWVGARGGLHLVRQKESAQRADFQVFGLPEGLPNETIHAIEEDQQGYLWLSTNQGVVVFDPAAADDPSLPAVIAHYDQSNGLQNSQFISRSSCRDGEGWLYFGGISGFNRFQPGQLRRNPHAPSVVLTELRLFNRIVQPGEAGISPLQKAIGYADRIVLLHDQNVLTLGFAALEFSQPEKNEYAYFLEGFDDGWIQAGNRHQASYNLRPGSYTFYVKAANGDGVWGEEVAQLQITVLPPFWQSTWAYVLYALAAISIIVAVGRWRTRQRIRHIEERARIDRARLEERARLRSQNAADFHDELGHRLTKISLSLELAERQLEGATPARPYLEKVRHHAQQLSAGIRDLIWSLDPEQDSLQQTVVRLRDFGQELFEHTGVRFQAIDRSPEAGPTPLPPDVRKQILLICKEALTNSLKYAAASQVILESTVGEGHWTVRVTDDGKGFDPVTANKGYGQRNMRKRAGQIGAELTIGSRLGQGTTIAICCKLPQLG